MRICYFGIKDRDYPRQRSISAYLEQQEGTSLDRIYVDPQEGFRRNLIVLTRFITRSRVRYDVVVLAEFSLQFAMLGWILSRKSKALFVVDWFVGLYETRVEDYGRHSKVSPHAIAYSWADFIAARLADLVVTDTEVRAEGIRTRYKLRHLPLTLPVGAPAWATYTSPSPSDKLRVLYYGNYIPLHGVDVFIKGALEATLHIPLEVTLVGDGPERARVEGLVTRSGASSACQFSPPVKEEELASLISAHDVIVGIFGSSPKARSVIANKVWQGLACGRRVLTQRTPALDLIRELFDGLLVECDTTPGDVSAELVRLWKTQSVSQGTSEAAATTISGLVEAGLHQLFMQMHVARNRSFSAHAGQERE